MTKGRITLAGEEYEVERKAFCCRERHFFRVQSVYTPISGTLPEIIHQPWETLEYIHDDSLWIFDLSDSTLLALSFRDAVYLGYDALPYSASWLVPLISLENFFQSKEDTSFIGHLPCLRYHKQECSVWICRGQPLGFSITSGFNPRDEKATLIRTDSTLAPETMKMPAGFRRIRPTPSNPNQLNHQTHT